MSCPYAQVIAECHHEWVSGMMVVSDMDLDTVGRPVECSQCDAEYRGGYVECPECHGIHGTYDVWEARYVPNGTGE